MNRINSQGFSLLEVIAAVVILAVVSAATVATVAPIRAKREDRLAIQEIARLNSLAKNYHTEQGRFPASLDELVQAGYLGNETAEQRDRLERLQLDLIYSPETGLFKKR